VLVSRVHSFATWLYATTNTISLRSRSSGAARFLNTMSDGDLVRRITISAQKASIALQRPLMRFGDAIGNNANATLAKVA
jgi:hypothetical protein